MIYIAHIVKCIYCGVRFDRDKVNTAQISERRYAHAECHQAALATQKQEELDKIELENYISNLFGEGYVNARTRKQLKSFQAEFGYTYSGMLKALKYFYEVKHGDKAKANKGVGILPYVYSEARDYYYMLWLANEQNKDKNIEEYKPETKVIKIPVPERKIRKRKLFNFLDEEVE